MADGAIAPASRVNPAAKVGIGVLVIREDGQVLVGKRWARSEVILLLM